MHEVESSMELPRELESISIAASQAMTRSPPTQSASQPGTLRAPRDTLLLSYRVTKLLA